MPLDRSGYLLQYQSKRSRPRLLGQESPSLSRTSLSVMRSIYLQKQSSSISLMLRTPFDSYSSPTILKHNEADSPDPQVLGS